MHAVLAPPHWHADAEVDPSWLPLPHDRPARPSRPDLRLIPGGPDAARRRRQPAAVYRRRRLRVVGVLLVVLTVAAVVATRAHAAGEGSGTPVPAAPAVPVASHEYVVQPGDTLWSIAEGFEPSGDIRVLVDRLAEANGGAALEAGQRLDLTGVVAPP